MNIKKRNIIITSIIAVVLVATIITVFALSPKDEPIDTAKITSDTPSSEPVSSVAIVVPEIKKPVKPQSSAPVSSEPVSSEPTSSALPVVDITASVDTKPTVSAPVSSAPASQPAKEEFKGDAMPQPNPDYAKPANRNMPSFTVDTSVVGAQGYHGQTGPCDTTNCTCSGTHYYHAGCDTWMDEEFFFVYRYGQHPEATDYLPYAPQRSPYQQDGDYNQFNAGREPGSGCYYCKACNGWIDSTAWENGRHGSGKNHIANTKKMG